MNDHTTDLHPPTARRFAWWADPSTSCRRFAGDDTGATAIEYVLIATAISLAIVGAVVLIGDQVSELFDSIVDAFG